MYSKKVYQDEEKLKISRKFNTYLIMTLYGGAPVLGISTLILFLFHPVIEVIQVVWYFLIITSIVSLVQICQFSLLKEKTIWETLSVLLRKKWRELNNGLIFFIFISFSIAVLSYFTEPFIQYSDIGIVAWGSVFLGYVIFFCLLLLSGLNLWARKEIVDQNKAVALRTYDIVSGGAKSTTDISKLIEEFADEFESSPNAKYPSIAIQTYLNKWVYKAGYANRSRALKEANEECIMLKNVSAGTLKNWEDNWCEFLSKRTES